MIFKVNTHCALAALTLAAAVTVGGSAAAQTTGPSTTTSPYVLPSLTSVSTTSILTVGDSIGSYRMVGIADGLGAFDNNDGSTFTLLMNHELGNTAGVNRAHGAKGSFISKWVINKSTLSVVSGADLMQQTFNWNTTTQASEPTPFTFAFNRFCSGDLPEATAFYNAATGLGTTARIYMHGEEGGSTGYQLGTVATGASAGNSYVLGKFNLNTNGSGIAATGAWENSLANPFAQDKTVVASGNDGGTGIMNNSVSVYVGTKQSSGSEVEKAGLMNGTLKFVNVTGNAAEIANTSTRATNITNGTRFSLSATASTTFSRPEDGAWNPLNPREFYFVTTDQLDQVSDGVGAQVGQTRLWRLTFDNITNPDLGGKIDLMIDGRTVGGEKVNMFDNITVNAQGVVILTEDVGNAAHNGKMWSYNPSTDALVRLTNHDVARFGDVGVSPVAPYSADEEASGILDVSSILGAGKYLFVDQAHYQINAANPRGFANPDELVEGGQLMAATLSTTAAAVPALPFSALPFAAAILTGLGGLLIVSASRRSSRA